MGQIPANQARGLFTQSLIDVYKQIPPTTNFLEMFFPKKTSSSRYLYWSVRRQGEPKAVDVIRGTDGNRNTFSISTDKIVDTPYFREFFDVTQTDLYYRAWDSQLIDESKMADWMSWVVEQTQSMHDKIKRAYEYQRAQVLTTGIVTVANGDNIDFKRNASSMLGYNASTTNWNATTGSPAVSTVNPFSMMADGAKYLRTYGKAMGGNFIVIMGENAKKAFDTNTYVLERQRLFNMKLDDLAPPFREANGSAYHGRISIGDYTADVFTYPQFYDASTASPNTSTNYINPNVFIMIPERPNFITGYSAVPFLPKSNESGFDLAMPAVQAGEYAIGQYMDSKKIAWEVDIRSAGIALPTAIDQIYTATVTAS